MSYYSCSFGDLRKSSPIGLHGNKLGCSCNAPRPQSDNTRPQHVIPALPTKHPHAESRRSSDSDSRSEFWETLLKRHEWRIHQMTLKKFELCDSIQELQLQVPAALLAQAHKTQEDLRKVVQQLTAASGDDLPSTCRTCMRGACPLSVPNNYPKNLFTFCYCKESDLTQNVRLPKVPVQKKFKVPKKATDRCSTSQSRPREVDKLSTKTRNTHLKAKRDFSPTSEEKPISIISNFSSNKKSRTSQTLRVIKDPSPNTKDKSISIISNTCGDKSPQTSELWRKTSFTKVKKDVPKNLKQTPITVISNSNGDKKHKTSEIWRKTAFAKVKKDIPPNLKDTSISPINYSYGDKKIDTAEICEKPSVTKVKKEVPKTLKEIPITIISNSNGDKKPKTSEIWRKTAFTKVKKDIPPNLKDTSISPINNSYGDKKIDTSEICEKPSVTKVKKDTPPNLKDTSTSSTSNNFEEKKVTLEQEGKSQSVSISTSLCGTESCGCNTDTMCIFDRQTLVDIGQPKLITPDMQNTTSFKKPDLLQPICSCGVCAEEILKRIAALEKQVPIGNRTGNESELSILDETRRSKKLHTSGFRRQDIQSICDCAMCTEETNKRMLDLEKQGIFISTKDCKSMRSIYAHTEQLKEVFDVTAEPDNCTIPSLLNKTKSLHLFCDSTECVEEVNKRLAELDRDGNAPTDFELICNCKECMKDVYKRTADLQKRKIVTLDETCEPVHPICNCMECTEENVKIPRIPKLSLPTTSCKSIQATCECAVNTEETYKMSTELEPNKIFMSAKGCDCATNTEEVYKTFTIPEVNKISLLSKDNAPDLYTEGVYKKYVQLEENNVSLHSEDYKSAYAISKCTKDRRKLFTELDGQETVASLEGDTSIHPICNCTNCAKQVHQRIADLDEHGTCALSESFRVIKPICGCTQCAEESVKRIAEMKTRRSDSQNLEEFDYKTLDITSLETDNISQTFECEECVEDVQKTIPSKCSCGIDVKMSDTTNMETLQHIQPICRCQECAQNICKRVKQIQAQVRNTLEHKHSRSAQLTKSSMQKGDFVQPICNCNECVEQTYKRITELQEEHYEQASKEATELQEHPMYLLVPVCSDGSLPEETKTPSKRIDVGSVKVLDIPNLKKSDLQPSCDCRRSNEGMVKLEKWEMNFVPSVQRASFKQLCKSPGEFIGNADLLHKRTADVKVGLSLVACRSRSVPSESITELLRRSVNKSNLTGIRGLKTTNIKMSAISNLRKFDIPTWRGRENKIVSAKYKGTIDMLYKIISEMKARITNVHGAVSGCKSVPLGLTAVLKRSTIGDINQSDTSNVQLINIFGRIKSDTQLISKDGRRAEEGSKFMSEIEQLKRCLSMMTYSCTAAPSFEVVSIKPPDANNKSIEEQNNITSEIKDVLRKRTSAVVCKGSSLKHSKASSIKRPDESNIKKSDTNSIDILNTPTIKRGKQPIFRDRGCGEERYNVISQVNQLTRDQSSSVCNLEILPSDRGESLKQSGSVSFKAKIKKSDINHFKEQKVPVIEKLVAQSVCTSEEIVDGKHIANTELGEQRNKSAVISSYYDVAEKSYRPASAEGRKRQSKEEMIQAVAEEEAYVSGISEPLEKGTQFKHSDISGFLKSGVSSIYKSHEVVPKTVSRRNEQQAYLSTGNQKRLLEEKISKQSNTSSSFNSNISNKARMNIEYFVYTCEPTGETMTKTRDPRSDASTCSCSQTSSHSHLRNVSASACSCSPAQSQRRTSFKQPDGTSIRKLQISGTERSYTHSSCSCSRVLSQSGTFDGHFDGDNIRKSDMPKIPKTQVQSIGIDSIEEMHTTTDEANLIEDKTGIPKTQVQSIGTDSIEEMHKTTDKANVIENEAGIPKTRSDVSACSCSQTSSHSHLRNVSTSACSCSPAQSQRRTSFRQPDGTSIRKLQITGTERSYTQFSCSCSRVPSQSGIFDGHFEGDNIRKSDMPKIPKTDVQSIGTDSIEEMHKTTDKANVVENEEGIPKIQAQSVGTDRTEEMHKTTDEANLIKDEVTIPKIQIQSIGVDNTEEMHKTTDEANLIEDDAIYASCSCSPTELQKGLSLRKSNVSSMCSCSAEEVHKVVGLSGQQTYASCTCSRSSSQSTRKSGVPSSQRLREQSVCTRSAEDLTKGVKQSEDDLTYVSVCSCSEPTSQRDIPDATGIRKSDVSSIQRSHGSSMCSCGVPKYQKSYASICSCGRPSSQRKTSPQQIDKGSVCSLLENQQIHTSICSCNRSPSPRETGSQQREIISKQSVCTCSAEEEYRIPKQRTYMSVCSCSQTSSQREVVEGIQQPDGSSNKKSDSLCTCIGEDIDKATAELGDQETYLSVCSCSRTSSQRDLSSKNAEIPRTRRSDMSSTSRSHGKSTCTCSAEEINKTVDELGDRRSFLSTSQKRMSSKQVDKITTKTSDISSIQRSYTLSESGDQRSSVCRCSQTSSQRRMSPKQSDDINSGKSDTSSNQKSQGQPVHTSSTVQRDSTSSERKSDVSSKQSGKSSGSKSDISNIQSPHKQSVYTSSTEEHIANDKMEKRRSNASECSCSRSSQKGTSLTQPREAIDRKSDVSKTNRSISTSSNEEIQNTTTQEKNQQTTVCSRETSQPETPLKEQDESSSRKSGASSGKKSFAQSTCTSGSKEPHKMPTEIGEPQTNVPTKIQSSDVPNYTSTMQPCDCAICAEEVHKRILELEEKGAYTSAPACACESAIRSHMKGKEEVPLENSAEDKVPTSLPIRKDIACDCTVCAEKVTETLGVVVEDEKPLDIDTYPICQCEICKKAANATKKDLPPETTTSETEPPICSCNDCKQGWPPVGRPSGDVKGEIIQKKALIGSSDGQPRGCICDSVLKKDTPQENIPESRFESVPESAQESIYGSVQSICVCSTDPTETSCSCPLHSQSLADDSCICKSCTDSTSIPVLTPASCTCTLTDLCTTTKSKLSRTTATEVDSSCKCMDTDSTTSSTTSSKSTSSDTSLCSCSLSDCSSNNSNSQERLPGRISSFSLCSCTRAPKTGKSEALEEYVKEIAFDNTNPRKR